MNLSLAQHLFKKHIKNKSYSIQTIKKYSREIRDFFIFVMDHLNKEDIREINKEDILKYQQYIFNIKKPFKDEPRYNQSTQKGIMQSLSTMFRYFSKNEYILTNPFDGINISKVKRHKEKKTLSVEDMNKFLDSINDMNVLDIRDRAIFELMYGTGLRVSEVVNLDITDIDLNVGKLFVRMGKGKKERMVPLGVHVINCLKLYLIRSRPYFVEKVRKSCDKEALFLTLKWNRIGVHTIEWNIKKRLKYAKIKTKGISPHVIRHTFATHMLEGGASLKHVKEILGHKSMQTTVIYTHFSVQSLKKIIKMYHPRENELYEEEKITEDFVRGLKD